MLGGNMAGKTFLMCALLNFQQQLQQENVALKESRNECERSLRLHQSELKKLKVLVE